MTVSVADIISSSNLPIVECLPALQWTLVESHQVVLQAEPGAGKTTLVPLALLNEPWLQNQKILVLEPRRLAARSAAERMASLLGESVGKTVGYRIRLESKVSSATQIEVITEGILTRMLHSDPSLEGVGTVIFDEFHERSLDADLGLALTLQSRKLFRDESDGARALKLIVMSATLDGDAVANLIGDSEPAQIINSAGRQYPVSVHYARPSKVSDDIVPIVVNTLLQVTQKESGSVLVFLPGQGEIRRTCERLAETFDFDDMVVAPLYGNLSLKEQRIAIAALSDGKRKIVLATAIAESSLTIEGVTVVVDAGLTRFPMFDPNTGMTRLHTGRVSKASSVQRMGRAGRLQAGSCYRLWSESQQQQLLPQSPAEILQADLAPLAMQLLSWGVNDPAELDWLDLPPAAPYTQALELLQRLEAIKKVGDNWQLTTHGEAMATLPLHPRLAHMLLVGEQYGLRNLACDIASVLSDRDPLSHTRRAALADRLSFLRENKSNPQTKRLNQQSHQYRRLCEQLNMSIDQKVEISQYQQLGLLLASAYPDRIAKRRSANAYDYQLASGRAARLTDTDNLQQAEWIVVANLGGRHGQSSDQIFLATEMDIGLFENALSAQVSEQDVVEWDSKSEKFKAEKRFCIGELLLKSASLKTIPDDAKHKILLEEVRKRGIGFLPWTEETRQWQARILMLRKLDFEQLNDSEWPDVSDEYLLATLPEWLGPYLSRVNNLAHFQKLELENILAVLLPWPLPQSLNRYAPIRIVVPSGSNLTVDYRQSPPVLSVKLQEMFGCDTTPRIASGRQPLMVHLLSPARRPLAVTQDLASFWQNAYPDVKKDMKGRYPKHPWPDNPLDAVATARAKPRK